MLSTLFGVVAASQAAPKPVPIVMQMTVSDSDTQRRAFLQIAKVLEDIGRDKVRIEVVAYEGGIHALLADNQDTATLLAALARQGVRFKACRISMRSHGLKEDDFPMDSFRRARRRWSGCNWRAIATGALENSPGRPWHACAVLSSGCVAPRWLLPLGRQ